MLAPAFAVAAAPTPVAQIRAHGLAEPAEQVRGGPNVGAKAGLWAGLTGLAGLAGLAGKKPKKACRPTARHFSVQLPNLPFMNAPDKKTVIITGASSGLGLAAARELAASGEWYVIMACRDFQKAERAAKDAGLLQDSYEVLHCDLASTKSVRHFAKAFQALDRPLDALVCNAAVYYPNAHKQGVFLPGLFPGGGPRYSAEGYEMSFAANYLGHFLLCKLLLEDLKRSTMKPARCVILGTVTATVNGAELGGMIPPLAHVGNMEGLEKGMKAPITMLDGKDFDGAKAYKDSKVCDVMLMKELHRRYHKETGIVFTSLYPGCIAETGLFREHYPLFQSLFPAFHKTVTKAYVSQEEAGRRLAACVSDERYGTSGSYYSWEGTAGTGGAGGRDAVDNTEKDLDWFMNYGSFRSLSVDEIGGEAADDNRCRKLWELSERLVESH
mmetsp:Transcript_27302/g.51103  ORF Transcript_27302/g.51103 Transcript_27302/m.51103 type:complete len:441 (+) Transcript_27302:58-1380(+)